MPVSDPGDARHPQRPRRLRPCGSRCSGAATSGGALAEILLDARRRHRRPHRASASSWSGSPWPTRPSPRRPAIPPTLISDRRRGAGGARRRRRRGRADRRARPGPRAGRDGPAQRQAGGHGQQGAAGRRRRRAGRGGRRAPASTCSTRRPWRAPSRSSGRCASRWPASRSCGSWASSTARPTYILTRMEEEGVGYDEALAEAQALGLAERDPTRRRRGARRRRQGGHPGRAGLRRRRRRRRRAPRGHQRRQRGRRRLRQPAGLRRSSCWPWPSWSTAGPRSRSGCTRPWCPDPPAGLGARRLQRRVRRGRGSGELMLYGRGAGGRPDGQRRAGRPGRRVAQPAAPARRRRRPSARAPRVRPQNDLRSAFYLSMDVADRPACWPRWPRSSATTACPSGRWSRSAWPTRPG